MAAGARPCADLLSGEAAVTGALPVIAIPSTAGTGSELNRSAVLTDPGRRVRDGLRSDHLFPRAALVDPEISASQPAELALRTGFDALSHAIESYVSPKARAETDRLAEAAIVRLPGALRSLELLYLEAGTRDEFHLQFSLRILVRRLNELGVPCEHVEFDGGHFGLDARYPVVLARLIAALGLPGPGA